MNNYYSKIFKKYYLNAWQKVYHRKNITVKKAHGSTMVKGFFLPVFSARDLGQRCTQGQYMKGLARSLTMYP